MWDPTSYRCTENQPETQRVPCACMWVGGSKLRVSVPFGTRGVCPGLAVFVRGTCEHLRGPSAVTRGEWFWRRGVLREGVWRRPETKRAFELQQPGGEQAATMPERSRKDRIGPRGPADGVCRDWGVYLQTGGSTGAGGVDTLVPDSRCGRPPG